MKAAVDEKSKLMETENESRLLFKFAMPAVTGMIAGSLYNIIDRIFIGNTVGSSGLGAIALGFPSMLLMIAVTLMIGIGGAAKISLMWGAKRKHHAQQALGHSVLLLMIAGLAAFLLGIFGVDFLLSLSGASENLLGDARTYVRIILLGGPFAILSFGLNFYIRASGSPSYAMGTQIVGAVCNVIFDALFILVFEWGVFGAALGTVLAQLVSTLWAVSYFFRPSCNIKIRREFLLKPRLTVLSEILAIGLPSGMIELVIVIFMTLINRVIQQYGGEIGLSVMGIFLSLDSLLFLPAIAIGEATQPIVGYNYGANKIERVIRTIKVGILWSTVFYLTVFVVVQLFARQMVSVFNSDPELLSMGITGMRVGYLGCIFMGIPSITSSALQGMARAKETLLLAFIRQVVFLLGFLFILPPIFGLIGVWMVFPLADTCGSLVALIFLLRLLRDLRGKQAMSLS